MSPAGPLCLGHRPRLRAGMDARGKQPGNKHCREQGQGTEHQQGAVWLGSALLAPQGPVLVMGNG